MKTELRFDRAALRKPTTTSQGFLRVEGHFSRAGIYEYRGDDGAIRRELRPLEEVGDPASLESFDAAPVTLGHPAEEVTADNVRKYEVGSVTGPGRMDGDHVAGGAVIKDGRAIKKAKAGTQELSPGYRVEIDETPGADRRHGYPGNPEGRYDAVQRHIRVNHLAIVDRARGGSTVRLRMDALEQRADGGRLTTAVNGHQHLIDRCGYDGQHLTSGTTTWAVSEGAEGGHSHDWICEPGGKMTIALSEGHAHEPLDDAALPVGTRVRALVDHMPGMRGQAGSIAEARAGAPPYYAVRFDDQKMFPGDHRWLTADEITVEESPFAATLPPRMDAQIDRSASVRESGRMDPQEQIRSLQAQLAAAEAKLTPLHDAATKHQARADAAEATISTLRGENTELHAKIAAAATVVETEAIKREKIRADAAEDKLSRLDAATASLVEQRVALERKVAVVMGHDFPMRGVTERQLVATAVKRLDAQADVGTAVSDAYLMGKFESLLDLHARNARSSQRVADIITDTNKQRADADDEKRIAYRNQWQEPLPNSREAQAARKGA